MEPRFRRRADGSLNLTDTMEAAKVKEANKGKPYARPLSPDIVLDKAKKSLSQHHGDPANRKHLLGFFHCVKRAVIGHVKLLSTPVYSTNKRVYTGVCCPVTQSRKLLDMYQVWSTAGSH